MDDIVRSRAGGRFIHQLPYGDIVPRHVRQQRSCASSALTLLFFLALPALGQTTRPDPASGFISFSVSTRSFSAPVFDIRSTTNIQVAGQQRFLNGSQWHLTFYQGFPVSAPLFFVEGTNVLLAGGEATIHVGDFAVESLQQRASDSYALEGASFGWQRGRDRLLAFAGRAKYRLLLPDGSQEEPEMLGAEFARDLGRGHHVGTGLILLRDASTPDGQTTHALGRVDYLLEISPDLSAFATGYLSDLGGHGTRLGARFVSPRTQLTASLFDFTIDLPRLYGIVRPGETGIDVSASRRLTEFSRIYGALVYLNGGDVLARENINGHVGFSYSIGTTGPYVDAAYYRDELTHDLLTGERETVVADRVSVSLMRASAAESLALRLDQVMRRNEPTRTQLLGSFSTLVGARSFVEASTTIQNESGGARGVTLEGSYNRPVRWPYSISVGSGVAFVQSQASFAGDAVARLGLSRQFVGQRSGWYARIDAKYGFPIGLARADLTSTSVSIALGNRFAWRDLGQARSMLAAMISPSSFGVVEGTVTLDGQGVAGVPIRIDGEQRSVTSGTGRYRVSRLPVGVVTVSIQPDLIEEDVGIAGSSTRSVLITPESVARADFALARFVSLVGSLVACAQPGEAAVGVNSASLALVGGEFVATASTASNGGFEFTSVPPGVYDLVIDPSSVPQIPPERLRRERLDLHADRFGYVLSIGCGADVPSPTAEQTGAPQGEIRGVVTINGKAAASATVLADGQRKTVTASDGAFRFAMPAGEYVVAIQPAGARVMQPTLSRKIVVRAGQTAELNFDVRQSVTVEGALVVCDRGRPVGLSGIAVTLFDAQHVAEATTTAGGRFSFTDVPTGKYLVLLDQAALLARGVSAEEIPRLLLDATRDTSSYLISIRCSPAVKPR